MRKLKLNADELVVETFEAVDLRDGQKGTIHGNDEDSWEPQTNDPRYRQCVTPYVECGTVGWTCDYRCTVGEPFTEEC